MVPRTQALTSTQPHHQRQHQQRDNIYGCNQLVVGWHLHPLEFMEKLPWQNFLERILKEKWSWCIYLSHIDCPWLLLDCFDVVALWNVRFHIFPYQHRVRIPDGSISMSDKKRGERFVFMFKIYLLARSLTLSMHRTLRPSSLRISKKPSYDSGMANLGPTGTT